MAAYGTSVAMVAPGARGWPEFITKKTGELLGDYHIDALYLDNTHITGSYAPNAALGYLREGRRMQEYPIMAYRELYKRIRMEMEQTAPNGLIVAHTSGSIAIPVLSFFNAYLNGEQFRGRVRDNYLDVVTLEAFRAEFMGRQWGLAPIFLPEFDDEFARETVPTRGLMALLMLHDVSVWPLWCNVQEVNRALAMLQTFGYEAAEFIPYFAPNPPARSAASDVYVSAYRKGDAWLLVVGNTSSSPRRSTICSAETYSLGRHRWWSLTDRAEVHALSDGCFVADLEGLDYDLLTSQQ